MKNEKMDNLKAILRMEPGNVLFQAVLVRIDLERVREAKRKFTLLVASSLTSFALFIVALRYAIQELAKSEFLQYMSLIFSDGTTVLSYWKQFLALMTESIPLLSISLLLATAFITLLTLRNLMRNFSHVSYKPFA